jgi:hypothetical protein
LDLHWSTTAAEVELPLEAAGVLDVRPGVPGLVEEHAETSATRNRAATRKLNICTDNSLAYRDAIGVF